MGIFFPDQELSEILNEKSEIKISSPQQNLKSKIANLNRSIENLKEKKGRIEFEISRQKKALYNKRGELKKLNSKLTVKAKASLESNQGVIPVELEIEQKEIQQLLQESARILES